MMFKITFNEFEMCFELTAFIIKLHSMILTEACKINL